MSETTYFAGLYSDGPSPRNALVDRLAREKSMREALEERRGSAAFYIQDFGLDRETSEAVSVRQAALMKRAETSQAGVKRKVNELEEYGGSGAKSVPSQHDKKDSAKVEDDVLLQAKALLGIIMKKQGLNEEDMKDLIKSMRTDFEVFPDSGSPSPQSKGINNDKQGYRKDYAHQLSSPASSPFKAKHERPTMAMLDQYLVQKTNLPDENPLSTLPPTPLSMNTPERSRQDHFRLRTPAVQGHEISSSYQTSSRFETARANDQAVGRVARHVGDIFNEKDSEQGTQARIGQSSKF